MGIVSVSLFSILFLFRLLFHLLWDWPYSGTVNNIVFHGFYGVILSNLLTSLYFYKCIMVELENTVIDRLMVVLTTPELHKI